MSPDPDSIPPPVVSLRGVAKTYAIWDSPADRLLAPLHRLLGRQRGQTPREFTAVRGVSLDVARGECLGIIGRNGAGKSTLLQMIAGTVQPSAGDIRVSGRVAALLELGSGFNPDFTGRENIQLNAAVLGLGREEIAAKFDAIAAYSGIAEFLEQPVRTYSSGMTMRLAFAVCVHVDADILIIDEALAVGDARFQFKCHATLEQMQREGRTIIFVSHDTNAIKRMCRTALLLERGEVLLQGSPNDVTNLYTKLITSPHGVEGIRADLEALKKRDPAPSPSLPPAESAPPSIQLDSSVVATDLSSPLLREERTHRQVSDKEYSYGGELGRIESVSLTGDDDQPGLAFATGSQVRVRISCRALQPVDDPIYAITLKDVRGQEIYGTNSYFQNLACPSVPAGGGADVLFGLKLNLLPGVYFISLGWVRLVNGEVQVIHRRYDSIRFDVLPRDRSFGLAWCPTSIHVHPQPPAANPAS